MHSLFSRLRVKPPLKRPAALLPRIAFKQCAACGVIFPPSKGRDLCWKHSKMWRGSVPATVIANDITEPLPGSGSG